MKKLLGLLGTISISASGGSVALTTSTMSNIQSTENKNISNFNNSENDIFFQITNLKKTYDRLTTNEKINFANEIVKLENLNLDEIHQFLENSEISFIKENKKIIEIMYSLSISTNKMSGFYSVAPQLNIDWKLINEYISLNFGDSNDYTPKTANYGPSAWWKVWEWGLRVDLPEGLANVSRIVNLLYSLYGDLNLKPVESIVNSAKTLFDYLINIDQHANDKMSVFYKMLVNIEKILKTSGLPFTNKIYVVFDEAISELKKWEALHDMLPISLATPIIKEKLSDALKMPFEEIGTKYSTILNSFIDALHQASQTIDGHFGLPDFIWKFFSGSLLKPIVGQIVNADKYHNGVYILIEQYLIPLGFNPR